jgi:signal transduction histidine kinase
VADPSDHGEQTVRVLLLEDDAEDAALLQAQLRQSDMPMQFELVGDEAQYLAALDRGLPDIVLADYRLRGYSGLDALRELRRRDPQLPFILVSGTLTDEVAAGCCDLGASDYILKDRLARLPRAVHRALGEHRLRTENARAEEELRQAQKMEAIGRLAGGIAHDFNNLLMVMRGFAELLCVNLPSGPERRNAEKIVGAADRAARLVAQLLAFGRKQVLSLRPLDLNECVGEVGRLLPRVLGEHIEIVVHPEAHLRTVKLDPMQIEQVLMNLAINARDAMPEGGRLLIETRNVDVDREFLRCHAEASPGPYVLLCVSDNGCGMASETSQHIFEPFFTTKAPGKGTGLGLATVYGIVRQSDGFIWVYSEPGKGTTFKLYFPAIAGASEPLARARAAASEVPLGHETVLVVEDEDGVRDAMTMFLRRSGYTVLEASHGERALEVARAFRGDIDLMVTDVVMPGVNGRELARRLAGERPMTRVLFVSGYSGSAMAEQFALQPDTPFLEKPFTWDAFARKVREVLDQARLVTEAAERAPALIH